MAIQPDTTSASRENQIEAENIRFSVPAILSILETAAVMTLSRRKVMDLIGTGKLKTVKVGRRRVVPRTSIESLLGIKLA